ERANRLPVHVPQARGSRRPRRQRVRSGLRDDPRQLWQRAGDGAARRAAGHRHRARPDDPGAGPGPRPGAYFGARSDDGQADLRAPRIAGVRGRADHAGAGLPALAGAERHAHPGCVLGARRAAARGRHGDGPGGVQRAGQRRRRRL
ncbi:MAG: CBS-domain-containing protein, partial [uncultured Ramlibacter sp.]